MYGTTFTFHSTHHMKALISVIALSALCASPVIAQNRGRTHAQSNAQVDMPMRDGFTLSFGLGGGSLGLKCATCQDLNRENGPAMYLRLGGAVRPNLILGGEINGWSKTVKDPNDESTVTVATLNAIAQWYPATTAGFYLSGGLGAGSLRSTDRVPGFATATDRTTGLGYQFGLGYDIRVRSNFSITPYANFFGTSGAKFENSQEKIDGNAAQIGLGLTWH